MSRAANSSRCFFLRRLACLALLTPPLPAATTPPADSSVAGEAIVVFKPTLNAAAARDRCAGHALKHVKNFPHLSRQRQFCHVRSPTLSTAQLIARLNADPTVEFAEPNYRGTLTTMPVPNDTHFAKQWALRNTGQTVNGYPGTPGADIGFLPAWGMANPDAAEILVAVIDSGIDLTHPDLAPNLWTNPAEIPSDGIDNDANGYIDDRHGFDFVNWDANPSDGVGHGTAVSGIIAATINNSRGIAGAAFHARILPLKFTDDSGTPTTDAELAAIDYAVMMKSRGVNIVAINASFKIGDTPSAAEYAAIQAAGNAGIVFCAAAGNDTSDNTAIPVYPANYRLSNMIVVAASDSDDSLASFSNYGTKVDLAAPGLDVYSTKPVWPSPWLTGTIPPVNATLTRGPSTYSAAAAVYSATTPGITAGLYDCGYGASRAAFPLAVNGNIALIQRGPAGSSVTFATKVANAMYAGAAAAIIYNNVAGLVSANLGSPGIWIPTQTISQADGQALLAALPTTVTLANNPVEASIYFYISGTSAAAPFVSAAVAFAARNFPLETAAQRVARILNGVTPVGTLTGKVLTGGRLNLAGIVDPGANAIPDWWETQYFGTIGINPAADPDADRFSNLQEYLIGTQPNNPASKLAIATTAVVPNGAARDFRITFPTATGVTYRVEFSDTLAPAPWTALGSDLTGTGATATVTDPNAVKLHPRRFYRVRILSPSP